jgi:hypothetical protein
VHPIGKSIAEAEKPLAAMVAPNIELTGTADILARNWTAGDWEKGTEGPLAISVIDWKTGRRDADHREQLLGYAALALLNYPEAAYAFGRIIWLRSDETEVYSMTREGLVEWRERLISKSRENDYQPGPHCQYCPRQFSCPAKQDMVRGALNVLTTPGLTLAEMPGHQKLDIYHKARSVAALAAQVLEVIRDDVRQHGAIQGVGTSLQLIEETRRTLKPAEAWPVLQQYLTEAQLAECVTVSLTKAEDAAAKGQPRGEGGKRTRAMLADLNTANAIGTSTIQKLTERRS